MNLKEFLESSEKTEFVQKYNTMKVLSKKDLMEKVKNRIQHEILFNNTKENTIALLENKLNEYAIIPQDIDKKVSDFLKTIPAQSCTTESNKGD